MEIVSGTDGSNFEHMGFTKNFTFNPNAMEFHPTRFTCLERSYGTPPPPPVQTAETAPQLIPIIPINSSVFLPKASMQPVLCIPVEQCSPVALSPMAPNSEYPPPPATHQWGYDKDYSMNCQPRAVILPPTQKAAQETIFIPFVVNKAPHTGAFIQDPGMPSVQIDESNSPEMHQPAIQYVTYGTSPAMASPPPAPNTANSFGQSNWQHSYDQTSGKYIYQRPGCPPIIGVSMANEFRSNIPPGVPFIQSQEDWHPSPNTHHQLKTPQNFRVAHAQTDNSWIYYGNGVY